MRRTLLALSLLAATVGCGDDGKTAPRGAPAAPPAAPSGPMPVPGAPAPAAPAPFPTFPIPFPSPSPASPAASPAASPWTTTRVGDWATWDVRVTGVDTVTKLTWRATKVDAAGVRYTVEARTLDVQGVTLSTVTGGEELHPAGDRPLDGVPETITVAGTAIDARKAVRGGGTGEVTVWAAPTVPFSGLVRSTSAAVEQNLVGFGRGP
jgi:hypothetical protein